MHEHLRHVGPVRGIAIAIDTAGRTYVTGLTVSPSFPTSPTAIDSNFNDSGHTEAFLTKVATDGTGLDYSTLLGGSLGEIGRDIEIDASGLACLTGETFSTDFPTTADALDRTSGGLADAFLCTIDVAASRILYSTVIGTPDVAEYGHGVSVDAAGSIFVAGDTLAGNFPADIGSPDDAGSAFAAAVPPLSVASCNPSAGNRHDTCRDARSRADFPTATRWHRRARRAISMRHAQERR